MRCRKEGSSRIQRREKKIQFAAASHSFPVTTWHEEEAKIPSGMKQKCYDNGNQSGCHEINVIYCQYENKEEWINGKYEAFFSRRNTANQYNEYGL